MMNSTISHLTFDKNNTDDKLSIIFYPLILNNDLLGIKNLINNTKNQTLKHEYQDTIIKLSISFNKPELLQYALNDNFSFLHYKEEINDAIKNGYGEIIDTLLNFEKIKVIHNTSSIPESLSISIKNCIEQCIKIAVKYNKNEIAINLIRTTNSFSDTTLINIISFDNLELYQFFTKNKDSIFYPEHLTTVDFAKTIAFFKSYNIAKDIIENHTHKDIFVNTKIKEWAKSYKNSITLAQSLNQNLNTNNSIDNRKLKI